MPATDLVPLFNYVITRHVDASRFRMLGVKDDRQAGQNAVESLLLNAYDKNIK